MSLSKNRKIASGVAALAVAGPLLVGGVYAAFTDTKPTTTQTINTGTVVLSLADGADATPPAKFTQTISKMAGGDVVYRALTVKNLGNLDLGSLSMTAAAAPANALTSTAPSAGLGVTVRACPVAWTIVDATTAPTCASGETVVKTATNLDGYAAPTAVTGPVLTAGGNAHLMFEYAMDYSVANTLQDLSTDVTYTFTGTQRAGVVSTQ